MCKVSVIVPTYKRSDLVLETLESVFQQTFTDYEVIVVNDGSPDNTRDVLRPLAEAGRIRYIEQPNLGQGTARNRGASEARGEYLAFLDDDDLWPADKLEWQVRALEAAPEAVLVYGRTQDFSVDVDPATGEKTHRIIRTTPETDTPPTGDVWKAWAQMNYIQSPGATLIRPHAFQKIGGYDIRINGTDDYDLYISLSRVGPFVFEDRTALYYRRLPNSMSRNLPFMYANAIKVSRKHLGLIPRPEHLPLWIENQRWIRNLYGDLFINATGDALVQNDLRRARALWIRAVTTLPVVLGRRHTYYLLKRSFLALL